MFVGLYSARFYKVANKRKVIFTVCCDQPTYIRVSVAIHNNFDSYILFYQQSCNEILAQKYEATPVTCCNGIQITENEINVRPISTTAEWSVKIPQTVQHSMHSVYTMVAR